MALTKRTRATRGKTSIHGRPLKPLKPKTRIGAVSTSSPSLSAMAMTCSQPGPDQPDLLSSLPDELLLRILSFLPTHIAARTSLLCRRFRHLWEASPSLHFSLLSHSFLDMVVHALIGRDRSLPLLSLCLDYCDGEFPIFYIPGVLSEAYSRGLRHLTILGLDLTLYLSWIFSIDTLESLSISLPLLKSNYIFPSGSTLPRLRRLFLELGSIYPVAKFGQFLSELRFLEDLHLEALAIDSLSLSSRSIKKLKLINYGNNLRLDTLGLFLPSLESFHLEFRGLLSSKFRIHGEAPLLKKAVINIVKCLKEDVSAVTRLLSFISHVEELSLRIKESEVTSFNPSIAQICALNQSVDLYF